MNNQYGNPDMVERTDKNMNNSEVYLDPIVDKALVEADLIHETPTEETAVHETPISETITHETPIATKTGSPASLLNREESEQFRTRWNEIQGKFVDEPRSAVKLADELVTEVIGHITEMFNNEHSSLMAQWSKGNDVSTEDLRIALQHYRSFFNSLVV